MVLLFFCKREELISFHVPFLGSFLFGVSLPQIPPGWLICALACVAEFLGPGGWTYCLRFVLGDFEFSHYINHHLWGCIFPSVLSKSKIARNCESLTYCDVFTNIYIYITFSNFGRIDNSFHHSVSRFPYRLRTCSFALSPLFAVSLNTVTVVLVQKQRGSEFA